MYNTIGELLCSHNPLIFVGASGSGKTEWSLNAAIHRKEVGGHPVILDLDVVKPYFRSREFSVHRELQGIEIISSVREGADLPALSPRIGSILRSKREDIIMDVGGGEGAVVLGQFEHLIRSMPYAMWMVVNTRRPFARTLDDFRVAKDEIEACCRLPVTGLVANSNLGAETDASVILEGFELVSHYARELGLPLVGAGIPRGLAGQVELPGVPILRLRRFVVPPWQEE